MKFEVRRIGAPTEIVEAPSEKEARHIAMVNRWGKPTGIYALEKDGKYRGEGLTVIQI